MNHPSWTDAERAMCRELLSRETRFERVAEPWARVQVVGEPLIRNAATGARHEDGFDGFLALPIRRGEKMLGLAPSRAAPRRGRCAPRRDDSGRRATPYRGRAPAEPMIVEADAAQLREVVMNPVINAGQVLFGSPGEVRIETLREQTEVARPCNPS